MSYTLKYTGAEIDDILDRAVEGGAIDEELALKAPLESPALTGTPTAPTPAESDNSTTIATTAYADRAALKAFVVASASGDPATFDDGADDVPMKSVLCIINPVQAGSGDPAPDNVRAISGSTSLIVTANGDSYPASWTGPIYKGTLDIVTGVLQATHAIATYTGADSWAESGNRWYKNASSLGIDTSKLSDSVSNQATYNDTTSYGPYFSFTSAPRLYLNKIAAGETLANVQTRLAANNLVICYPLATLPAPIQLTQTEINSVLGSNSVGSDSGPVTVEYRADTALYIASLTGNNTPLLSMVTPVLSQSITPEITPSVEPEAEEE